MHFKILLTTIQVHFYVADLDSILLSLCNLWLPFSMSKIYSGGKTAQRNVEITMSVVTDKGRIINVSLLKNFPLL